MTTLYAEHEPLASPLKWHGGKSYLADRIIALFPPRSTWLHYVEPFAGGLSVLLANDPDEISEVVNDLHGDLTNFCDVLRDVELFQQLHRMLEASPFSEPLWERCQEPGDGSQLDRAFRFFITCRQSLAGRMAGFTSLTRSRVRRGMNGEVSAWLSVIEGLPAVHERLKRVVILNRDALDVITGQDGDKTLFYLDPPYLHTTRATTTEYGDHEMTYMQHCELLTALGNIKGRFLLSGYPSDLYTRFAKGRGWTRHDFELPNNAAGGKEKRRMTECVWANF